MTSITTNRNKNKSNDNLKYQLSYLKTIKLQKINSLKSPNYLVIVYLVKKIIQILKSCVKVKRILKIKPYHLFLLNDLSSFYKDGSEFGNNAQKNSFRSIQNPSFKITSNFVIF